MHILNLTSFILNLTYFIALLYLSFIISNVKFSSKLRTDPSLLPLKSMTKLLLTLWKGFYDVVARDSGRLNSMPPGNLFQSCDPVT